MFGSPLLLLSLVVYPELHPDHRRLTKPAFVDLRTVALQLAQSYLNSLPTAARTAAAHAEHAPAGRVDQRGVVLLHLYDQPVLLVVRITRGKGHPS